MTFDTIKLDKGLYTAGKGFTKTLEEIDPSENYRGTELEGLDAYQRQLKRFDIKVAGSDSDTVSKFFQSADSAALFPEYVSRAVRMGIEKNDAVDKVVATTTVIDSLDYRAIELETGTNDTKLADVAEGAFIPEAVIKTKETLTPLKKRGRMLVASYEAIKFQKLDLFTVMLNQIGESIARSQLSDIAEMLINDNDIRMNKIGSNLAYDDFVNMWSQLAPYNLTSLICSSNTIATILKLDEFKDSAAGMNFHATGNLVTPLGAEIVKINDGTAGPFMIGLDKNYAIEKVQAGDIITDFDKLIDRQLERATITAIAGFSRIIPGAARVMVA